MQRLSAQAAERPQATALVFRDERIAWAELVERVERLADGLAERGIGAGDAVGLVLKDDPWFVTVFHAVTALGAVAVPVNPAFKQAELELCFHSADVRGIVADERAAGVCERIAAGFGHPVEVIVTTAAHGQALTLEQLAERGSARPLAPRDPDEPFVYQFSSGSTGRPKRVPRTHGQVAAEADLYATLPVGSDDRVFSAIREISPDEDLLATGIVDSHGVLQLVAFLRSHYGVTVSDEELKAENFQTLAAIEAFIERART